MTSEFGSRRRGLRRSVVEAGVRDSLLLGLAVLPLVVAIGTGFGRSTVAFVVVSAANVGACLRLRTFLRQGAGRALDSAFWVFVVAFSCTPFVAQIGRGVFPLDRIGSYRPSASAILLAAVALAVGCLGYETGWRFSQLRQRQPGSRPREERAALDVAGLKVTAVVAVAMGLAAGVVAVMRHGFSPFLTSRQAVEAAYYRTGSELNLAHLAGSLAGGGFELQLTRNASALGFLTVIATSRGMDAMGARLPHRRAALLLSFLPCLLINSPIATSRTAFASVVLGWWLLKGKSARRPGRYGAVVAVSIVVLMLIFPALDVFRMSEREVRVGDPLAQMTTDLDYSPVEQSMRVVDHVRSFGHTGGRQALGAGLVFLPRSVWKDKPLSTTNVVSADTGLVIGTPIWAEGFLEFGLVGAFAYPACLGLVVGRLSRRFSGHSSEPVQRSALALAVGVCVLLVRGDLLSSAVTVYGVAGVALGMTLTARALSVGHWSSRASSEGARV